MHDNFHLKEPNMMIQLPWPWEGFGKMVTLNVNNSMFRVSANGYLEEKIPYLFIREPVNKSNTHLSVQATRIFSETEVRLFFSLFSVSEKWNNYYFFTLCVYNFSPPWFLLLHVFIFSCCSLEFCAPNVYLNSLNFWFVVIGFFPL